RPLAGLEEGGGPGGAVRGQAGRLQRLAGDDGVAHDGADRHLRERLAGEQGGGQVAERGGVGVDPVAGGQVTGGDGDGAGAAPAVAGGVRGVGQGEDGQGRGGREDADGGPAHGRAGQGAPGAHGQGEGTVGHGLPPRVGGLAGKPGTRPGRQRTRGRGEGAGVGAAGPAAAAGSGGGRGGGRLAAGRRPLAPRVPRRRPAGGR